MSIRNLVLVGTAFVLLAGCSKKAAVVAPPPPPPGPAPVESKPAPVVAAAPKPAPVQQAKAAPAPATPRMPDQTTRVRIQDLIDKIQDVYFDYDRYSLRPEAMDTLKSNARTLTEIIQQYPEFKLTIEGHADERGTAEYNLGLGEARAKQAKEFLTGLGLPAAQLSTVSYGKEKPICTETTESCYQKNRRAHIARVL